MTDLTSEFSFFIPTRIEFGTGLAKRLGELCRSEGFTSAMVVADPAVMASGSLDGALQSLQTAGVSSFVWSEVQPNPTDLDVVAGLAVFHAERPDVIVGIGGGSALDTAKGVAVLASNGGTVRDYAGNSPTPRRAWPLVLVPTTAGTGSEVTANISITDTETHEKLALRNPKNYATLAVLDPSLLSSLPTGAAASAGMDALSHAVESYVSLRATPLTKLLAFEATRLIGGSLTEFVADRTDLVHASRMLYASCLAGIAISHTGTGNAHAVARALGGPFGVAHGTGCAVALEPVMRFNSEAVPEQYAELARALDVADSHANHEENALRAGRRVGELRHASGLPQRLDLHVSADMLPMLAKWTAQNAGPNPRHTSLEDAESLIREVVFA